MFRAIEVWPTWQEPFRTDGETSGTSDASHSTLVVTLDDPEKPDLG
jgi:hypothetical protein